MAKIKKVEPDKITYTDGTTLTTRDGDNLLELYYSSVYDILTTKKGDAKNPLTPFVKEGISKLKESSLIQLDRLVKQTAEYYAPDTLDSEFIEYRLSKRLFPWQRQVFNSTAKKITLCCGRRCWTPETEILMADGKTKQVKYILLNDKVMGADNKPHKVIEIHEGIDDIYELYTVKKNISFKCNSKHILTLMCSRVPDYPIYYQGYKKNHIYDIPLDEFLKFPTHLQRRFSIFRVPIEYKERKHIISPWLLGLWLGDGTSISPSIAVGTYENNIIANIENEAKINNWRTNYYQKKGTNCYQISISGGMLKELKELKLIKNKRIPDNYLIDSFKNRYELLAGLIDSDGYKPKSGNALEFCNTNKTLIDDVIKLCHSLGLHTTLRSKIPYLNGKPCKRAYTISIKGSLSKIHCRAERKNCLDSKQPPYFSFKIRKIGKGEYKGFTVEGNKRILLGDYTINHNCGKTFADAILAINHCTTPNDNFNGFIKPRKVAIIGLTIEKTAEIFWDNLIAAADISKMPYKANNSKYLISFNNGATVQLFGNSTKAEREKLRGTEFSLIIIDEAQSQNNLNYLLTDILGPIITGRDSTVILSGTGSLTGRGTWVDLCESPNYQHFHYTMADNPSIPSTALDDILREKGWTPDNITYQREYLALHVIDTTRTIVPKWHTVKALPDNFIAAGCYVGVDYGYEDYNAFVPIVWNNEGNVYCLKSIKFNHASSEDIVNKAKELEEELNKKYKVKPIFIADNSDQSISQSIFRKGISIHNAYKVDLKAQITDTKEYIVNGTIQFVEADTKEMIEEFKNLVWKWDDNNKCVVYEEDVDYYHGHVFHALRYALNTYRMKYRK